MSLGTFIVAAENFAEKGIKGAENLISEIESILKKETPEIEILFEKAKADYQLLLAAEVQDEVAIAAIKAFILEIVAIL